MRHPPSRIVCLMEETVETLDSQINNDKTRERDKAFASAAACSLMAERKAPC
jgi:hypothetical protein